MQNNPEFTRVLVAGCACVITSLLTYDQIARYKNYHPDALVLSDEEDGHELFSIDLTDGPGCLHKDHAEYSPMKSSDGRATITILISPDVDDREAVVREKICPCLLYLDQLEHRLLDNAGLLDEEENKAISMVTFT